MFRKFRVHFSVMTSYRTALRAGLQMAHRPSLLICIANDDNWIVIIHFIYLYECNWISSLFFDWWIFPPPCFRPKHLPLSSFCFLLSFPGSPFHQFKFAILCAGFKSRSSAHEQFYLPITLPTLHVFGDTDQVIPKGDHYVIEFDGDMVKFRGLNDFRENKYFFN